MTLTELTEIAMTQIVIRYPDANGKWYASLEHAEVKDHEGSAVLSGAYGRGVSPYDALNGLTNALRGKLLVMDAGSDRRRTIGVPRTLESGEAWR